MTIKLTREEAQQVLDALLLHAAMDELEEEAIELLRARLAQPEPLPAKSKGALSHEENKQHNKKILYKFYEENAHLYTTPPQRDFVGLTGDEISECWGTGNVVAAVEAKLKEKNT